jgi:hypothetical protein
MRSSASIRMGVHSPLMPDRVKRKRGNEILKHRMRVSVALLYVVHARHGAVLTTFDLRAVYLRRYFTSKVRSVDYLKQGFANERDV